MGNIWNSNLGNTCTRVVGELKAPWLGIFKKFTKQHLPAVFIKRGGIWTLWGSIWVSVRNSLCLFTSESLDLLPMKMRNISSLSTVLLRMNFKSCKRNKFQGKTGEQDRKKSDLHTEGISLKLKIFSSQFIHWLVAWSLPISVWISVSHL